MIIYVVRCPLTNLRLRLTYNQNTGNYVGLDEDNNAVWWPSDNFDVIDRNAEPGDIEDFFAGDFKLLQIINPQYQPPAHTEELEP